MLWVEIVSKSSIGSGLHITLLTPRKSSTEQISFKNPATITEIFGGFNFFS